MHVNLDFKGKQGSKHPELKVFYNNNNYQHTKIYLLILIPKWVYVKIFYACTKPTYPELKVSIII